MGDTLRVGDEAPAPEPTPPGEAREALTGNLGGNSDVSRLWHLMNELDAESVVSEDPKSPTSPIRQGINAARGGVANVIGHRDAALKIGAELKRLEQGGPIALQPPGRIKRLRQFFGKEYPSPTEELVGPLREVTHYPPADVGKQLLQLRADKDKHYADFYREVNAYNAEANQLVGALRGLERAPEELQQKIDELQLQITVAREAQPAADQPPFSDTEKEQLRKLIEESEGRLEKLRELQKEAKNSLAQLAQQGISAGNYAAFMAKMDEQVDMAAGRGAEEKGRPRSTEAKDLEASARERLSKMEHRGERGFLGSIWYEPKKGVVSVTPGKDGKPRPITEKEAVALIAEGIAEAKARGEKAPFSLTLENVDDTTSLANLQATAIAFGIEAPPPPGSPPGTRGAPGIDWEHSTVPKLDKDGRIITTHKKDPTTGRMKGEFETEPLLNRYKNLEGDKGYGAELERATAAIVAMGGGLAKAGNPERSQAHCFALLRAATPLTEREIAAAFGGLFPAPEVEARLEAGEEDQRLEAGEERAPDALELAGGAAGEAALDLASGQGAAPLPSDSRSGTAAPPRRDAVEVADVAREAVGLLGRRGAGAVPPVESRPSTPGAVADVGGGGTPPGTPTGSGRPRTPGGGGG